MTQRAPRQIGLFVLLVGFIWTPAATGRDYILTIGGGYAADGNQISLEQNVVFFRTMLAQRGLAGVPHDVLFSDGDAPQRDVQLLDLASVPRANLLMAQVFDREEGLGITYRNHELANVRAGANLRELGRWFDEVGSRLGPGDRLLIYTTAHGGESTDRRNPENSKLYLWNHEEITVSQMARQIASLPRGVQVTLVMVQCFSGGFANLIYEDGDPNRDLVDRDISGFFATVYDRVAAGCTPDIEAADYQEYSTHFWAALGGKTRAGAPVEPPDYDHDGAVSLEEAHHFVILHSSTIDIPVRTTGALLRKYSGIGEGADADLVGTSSYETLLEHASPSERAVLEGLSEELSLVGRNRVQAARYVIEEANRRQANVGRRQRRAALQLRQARDQLVNDLTEVWPELANPYNPKSVELLTTNRDEFVRAVESHPIYPRFAQLHEAAQTAADSELDADRLSAKAERFIRVAENVALAANLPTLAEPAIVERYQRLLAAERGPLLSVWRTAAAAPASRH